MSASGTSDPFRLGFLTAVEDAERGLVGGLLITNRFGRPLEFQCTTPVRPNKTQQILYGPTLRPYLLTEVVGRTLVEKVSVKPDLVLTESDELLELRTQVDVPVASLCREPAGEQPLSLKVGQQWLQFHPAHDGDRQQIARRSQQVPTSADLQEPFDRIREALTETLKAASKSA
jgi:hypothetical protein